MTAPDPPAARRSHLPAGRLLWSLVEDVAVLDRDDGGLCVVAGDRSVVVADPSDIAREVLHRMQLGPVALENVAGLRPSFDAWAAGAGGECREWRQVKALLDELGSMVVLSLAGDHVSGGPMVSTTARADGRDLPPGLNLPPVDPTRPVRIRPTARLDRGPGTERVLTDPGSPFRIVLHTAPAVTAVEELIRAPRAAQALAGPGLEPALAVDVVAFLAGGGMLEPVDGRSPVVAESSRQGITR